MYSTRTTVRGGVFIACSGAARYPCHFSSETGCWAPRRRIDTGRTCTSRIFTRVECAGSSFRFLPVLPSTINSQSPSAGTAGPIRLSRCRRNEYNSLSKPAARKCFLCISPRRRAQPSITTCPGSSGIAGRLRFPALRQDSGCKHAAGK